MKCRRRDEVRNEFVSTSRDEAEVAAFREEALDEVRAYRLADVRQKHGLTQVEVAERLHVSQTAVSKIERGELARSELSTIRRYVEAIGGKLEIVADFGDERLVLG
ncbi:XRE family transcriptional regulator [Streptomyces sp. SID13031]|uniref:helix-turn-helix domain-containing protein n=1 Tax=Streptomyces sp. SID13031 TaxID=2706046 RepID=UPI0013C60077|nr:XRE family transcriptional regulator [Streptomyces sp. SID13031]NEA35585.1 XRE family transcriptional regulator [Streptomyces sp. SID13031]